MEDPRRKPEMSLSPAALSRRSVVLGVSAVGAAGLLAACGGGGSDATAAPGDDPGSDAGSAPESSASESTSSGGGGSPLVKTAKVPVGNGVILQAKQVVVVQPTAGTFKAFSAICTHQQCTVGSIEDGVITCPCHGSEYSAADGSVKRGPASRALAPIDVTVQGDEVVKA